MFDLNMVALNVVFLRQDGVAHLRKSRKMHGHRKRGKGPEFI